MTRVIRCLAFGVVVAHTQENKLVAVIGGAAVDIQGAPEHALALRDSNPGAIRLTMGGVGRNVAETVTRLGIETHLLTAIGGDVFGDLIRRHCETLSIDIKDALFLDNERSATFMFVNEDDGDLALAIADMGIIHKVDPTYLKAHHAILEKADVIMVETNLSQEALAYILEKYHHKPIFCDVVSCIKSQKIVDHISYLHTIKPNQYEAEYLSGIQIQDSDTLNQALDYFLNKGLQQVFITLGRRGAFFGTPNERGFVSTPNHKPVNTLGAGDAFLASCVASFVRGHSISEATRLAMMTSYLTVQHIDTVSPEISEQRIQQLLQQFPLVVERELVL